MTTDAVDMVCQDFIDRYTEFRDGSLGEDDRARFEDHLDGCVSCRRYDHVISRGLALWRAMPGASTSPDFLPRLQHRLYHVQDAGKLSPGQHLGSAALIAVASVGLLAVTWLPFATRVPFEVELPAVAVEAPAALVAERRPSLFEDGPYVKALGSFGVPMRATLDESAGLFTTGYMTVFTDTARPPLHRRGGQLDESR